MKCLSVWQPWADLDDIGRWSIRIKKKATSDALLKPLIKKLADLLGL